MKKLTLTLAVLVTVIGTAFATGDSNKDNRVKLLPGEDRYKLIYTDKESSVVQIRIRNEDGKLLRTDRIKNDGGFMKPYNTKDLAVGSYTFEVKDQYGVVKQKIEIAPEKEIQTMEVKELSDRKYRLIVEQQGHLPFVLSILDANYDVIHTEKYEDLSGFTRVYDLSKFDSDNFTFELTDDTTKRVVSVQ